MFFFPPILVPDQTDLSLLYNPLIYSNTFFWPSTFLLPYQNAAAAAAVGMMGTPVSPGVTSMRDYTLTPEKEEVPEIDEDEPLNLSTRPRSPTPNTPPSGASMATSAAAASHHNLSRSHALIWSPPSICEKEFSKNGQSDHSSVFAAPKDTMRVSDPPFLLNCRTTADHEHSDSPRDDLHHHQTPSPATPVTRHGVKFPINLPYSDHP